MWVSCAKMMSTFVSPMYFLSDVHEVQLYVARVKDDEAVPP